VPFYVRTGKHMAQRTTEIAISFKQAPYSAFQDTPVDSLRPNWLVLGIAPSQGISLQFEVKRPGSVLDLAAVKMVSATMVPQGAERRIRDADP
jgi:glucose-6-phosphate 1-dehydrogenase